MHRLQTIREHVGVDLGCRDVGVTQHLLHGSQIGADEALRLGLVSAVLEPDALLPHCQRWLTETLANGPRALASALRAIREGLDVAPLEEALEVEARLFAAACGTPEMRYVKAWLTSKT